MRVLAASDLHGDHEIYRWLVQAAHDLRPDAVVLAGDLLGYPEGHNSVEEAQRADAARILAILDGVAEPVFYIMGNDDMIELDPKTAGIRSIQGRRVELDDFNFVGYQYSLPFMAGVYEKPEEDIHEDLAALDPLVDQRTVLVTHSPAYGVLDIGAMGAHAGSAAIKDLIDRRRPLVHIHGHIHEEFGRRGRHFNAASAGRRRAVLIELPGLDHEVVGYHAV